MKLSSIALLAGAGLASATPAAKRAEGVTDADILNYALTLEHLEAAFYEEGMKNYTHEDFVNAGCADPFFANLKQAASDEKQHEMFLTQALTAAGATPVEKCSYSFPATDVKSFLALASVLEGVGVSAYLGAAAHIMNSTYLTAAGSILTVEARHSAYLRSALKEVPFAQAFDNPLDFNEVYTVASPFIQSCPQNNPKLPVKAFPSLTMGDMHSVMEGAMVTLMPGDGYDMNAKDVHAAFVTATGPVWAPVKMMGQGKCSVTVPEGVAGQSYVVLTKGNKMATDDTILAGPAIVEVCAKDSSMPMASSASNNMMMMPSSASSMDMPMPMMTSGSMMSMMPRMTSESMMSMTSGGSMMPMPTGGDSMMMSSSSIMMPSNSMMMPSSSMMMPSQSSSMSSTPMFTGAAGRVSGEKAGVVGVAAVAVAAML